MMSELRTVAVPAAASPRKLATDERTEKPTDTALEKAPVRGLMLSTRQRAFECSCKNRSNMH